MDGLLFAADAPELQWTRFQADGFDSPACGVVYRAGQSRCGAPVGGIGTGCMDIETDGRIGRSSIFNSYAPPRDLFQPFLTLTAGNAAWTLSTQALPGTRPARDVRYWGHFPVADLEFHLDGPVGAALRAWSPFLPGDSAASNTPGAVFEVRLVNGSDSAVSGELTFAFPGPSAEEAGDGPVTRRPISGAAEGVEVCFGKDSGWALAAVGQAPGCVRASEGGEGSGPAAASLSVPYQLQAGQRTAIRFVLAWFCPRWEASFYRWYVQAYSARWRSAGEVALSLAGRHEDLLRRVLAWQQVIYSEERYPVWLRDQLVNILHTITEDALWAADSVPEAPWCRPDGIFGLLESPRTVPHVAIPSDWYGCLPFVFFFPNLMAALLRCYSHYQLPDGEVPLGLGWYLDLGSPIYDFLRTTNGPNFVDLAGRLWVRDRSDAVLAEFLPAVKKAIVYTQGLDRDGDGLPDLDPWPTGNQFYGAWHWVGTATHPNGYWLAALRIAGRMAEAAGDHAFAADCEVWFRLGSRSLEEKLWNGDRYLLYHDTAKGEKSDTILSNQLAGQWIGRLHGVGSIFPPERVGTTLQTVKKTTVPLSDKGVRNAIASDGSVDTGGELQSTGIFTGETVCLACTMAYEGDSDAALDCVFRLMRNLVLDQRLGWDLPNNVDPGTGEAAYGTDFYQMMILWALPMALDGADISAACAPGSIVARILQAASEI